MGGRSRGGRLEPGAGGVPWGPEGVDHLHLTPWQLLHDIKITIKEYNI